MKTVFRFLVTSVGLVLIVMALGAILFSTQAGAFADAAFERMLGYIYQTNVTIEHVVFLPRDRALMVQGLTIHNPPPFKEGPAIALGEVLVRVDPTTLLSAQPTVREVVMKDAAFYVRYEAGRGTNLGKLDENANRFNTTSASTSEPLLAKREYVIRSFRSEAAKLDLSANFIPGSSLHLDVAPFTLEDLSSSTPVSTTQIGSLFIRSLLREAITARGLMKPVADRLNEELERLRERSEPPAAQPERV
ncbi:MAG: hypothetical protein HUU46_15385 [Candidatus Hydrogenedentes bacterium]|nr:hypothetical protein [Candidatus Hydrogenedentota bacterium]